MDRRKFLLGLAQTTVFSVITPSFISVAKATVPQHVDKHVVIILDASGSIVPEESKIMRKGLANALIAEANSPHFDSATQYAVSLVWYGRDAKNMTPVILSNREQIIEFVQTYIWNYVEDKPADFKFIVNDSTSTKLNKALSLTNRIYQGEREIYGITSSTKSVLVCADDPTISMDRHIQAEVELLERKHRATIYGAGIFMLEEGPEKAQRLKSYFENRVVTSEERSLSAQIREGEYHLVYDTDQMERVVGLVFDNGLY
jgi:hypothetical protein